MQSTEGSASNHAYVVYPHDEVIPYNVSKITGRSFRVGASLWSMLRWLTANVPNEFTICMRGDVRICAATAVFTRHSSSVLHYGLESKANARVKLKFETEWSVLSIFLDTYLSDTVHWEISKMERT